MGQRVACESGITCHGSATDIQRGIGRGTDETADGVGIQDIVWCGKAIISRRHTGCRLGVGGGNSDRKGDGVEVGWHLGGGQRYIFSTACLPEAISTQAGSGTGAYRYPAPEIRQCKGRGAIAAIISADKGK